MAPDLPAGRPRVLFVGHGAERSGPPRFLLHLQRWVRDHDRAEIETVLARGGDLTPDLAAIGPVRVLDDGWTTPRVLQAGLSRLAQHRAAGAVARARARLALGRVRRADLVYLNTASSGGLAAVRALPFRAPLLTHVHELEVGLRYGLRPDERQHLFVATDRFVAASQAVADNLVDRYGVARSRVAVHHEVVDRREGPDPVRAAALRRRLGLEDGRLVVVGASGMTDWRKAPDLFVRLAWEVGRRPGGDRVRFLWVGGADAGPEWWPLDHDLRHLGLEDRVHFLGTSPNAADELSLCDVFVSPAREDAFPLACLEAGALGVPIVCFDSGGMPELVGPKRAGAVVAYPDVAAMADAVLGLVADPAARAAAGRRARAAVHAEHDVAVALPALWEEVERLC